MIADSCTRRSTFGTTPDGFPLWCEYRPMLDFDRRALAERVAWLLREAAPGAAQADHLARAAILERVVYWNLRDAAGTPLPLLFESLQTLTATQLGALFALVTGFDDPDAAARRESEDARRLTAGIRLARLHPEVATRDCADCLRHVYDEATGERVLHRGRPVPRPAGTDAPCRLPHVGCPKGSPEDSRSLDPRDLRVWLFDLECRAVGRFPQDPLVARHAALIRAAETIQSD